MPNTTEYAVRRQIEAMTSQLFEIGVLLPANQTGDKARDEIMLLRTWDAETLQRSIPWLRAKNASGAAIYIRPHGEHRLSLVDDLTVRAVEQMKGTGFEPALVIETSPGNFQVWLDHGTPLDKKTSTAAARMLAEKFGGDPGSADWRHFGRLAGFANRKPKYQKPDGLYPFVRIIEHHAELVYGGADNFLLLVKENLRQEELKKSRLASVITHQENGNLKTIEQFRADPTYAGDGNRIDLAYAVYALAHGVGEDTVRRAIGTRDLSKKGSESRQDAYITRTVSKALDHLGICHRS